MTIASLLSTSSDAIVFSRFKRKRLRARRTPTCDLTAMNLRSAWSRTRCPRMMPGNWRERRGNRITAAALQDRLIAKTIDILRPL